MRKKSVFIVLALLSYGTMAQDSSGSRKEVFQKRAKSYETISLVSLGVAVVSGVVAAVSTTYEFYDLFTEPSESDLRKEKTANVLAGISLGSTAVALSFYIASRAAKKKSRSMSFQTDKILSLQNGAMSFQRVPTLTFKINLSK
jgi:hypothetical protein